MSLLLASMLLVASTSVSPASTCTWDRPGAEPFRGDVVAAVDHFNAIPAPIRDVLKQRMALHAYDEVVTIRRDAILGSARYAPEIYGMHFGAAGAVCGQVTRANWDRGAAELALVYCESGHCVMVPTVCNNVAYIKRLAEPTGLPSGPTPPAPPPPIPEPSVWALMVAGLALLAYRSARRIGRG